MKRWAIADATWMPIITSNAPDAGHPSSFRPPHCPKPASAEARDKEGHRPAAKRGEHPPGNGRGQYQHVQQPVHGFRAQPLPWPERSLRGNGVSKSPREPENDEHEDDNSKGNMERHGGAGLHAA